MKAQFRIIKEKSNILLAIGYHIPTSSFVSCIDLENGEYCEREMEYSEYLLLPIYQFSLTVDGEIKTKTVTELIPIV